VHVVNVVGWKAAPVGSSHGHLSRLWRLNFLGNQRDSLHPPSVAMHISSSLYFFCTPGMRHVPSHSIQHDFISASDEGMRGVPRRTLSITWYSPHGSRNQNCMRGHRRPSIQGTRSHRRKRCLSPANDTDTPREALLKRDESHIAVENPSESVVAVDTS
jgi:hypothetical protein